jgi:hypothetical protein
MSRATRQEVLIRSLIEGLCLTLQKHLNTKTRQKTKLLKISKVMDSVEELWSIYPIQLEGSEGKRVFQVIDQLGKIQDSDPVNHTPEVQLGMVMSLVDHLRKVITKPDKAALVSQINLRLQGLYESFDGKGRKLDLMEIGGNLADKILNMEV